MDASRLLNVLYELAAKGENEPVELALAQLTENFRSGSPKAVDKALEDLKEAFDDSFVNSYGFSNIKIVEFISGQKYFGNTAYKYILEILSKNLYNSSAVFDDLTTYINERKEFVTLVSATKDNLLELNFGPHFSNSEFEIGLLMPSIFTNNKIIRVTKELNKWDKVIRTIRELNNEIPEDTKLDSVDNGSLDFFIHVDEHTAMCLSIIVERVFNIYAKIIEIKKKKAELRELGGLAPAEKKEIEKNERDIFDAQIDQLGKDVMKEFASKKIEQGRLNELSFAVKGHITYIAKCVNDQMVIEITPPELSEPPVIKADATEDQKIAHKKAIDKNNSTLEAINVVQKSMDVVKSIAETGIEVMKYLNEGDEPADAEPKDDKAD